jgi:hypothetical protein
MKESSINIDGLEARTAEELDILAIALAELSKKCSDLANKKRTDAEVNNEANSGKV